MAKRRKNLCCCQEVDPCCDPCQNQCCGCNNDLFGGMGQGMESILFLLIACQTGLIKNDSSSLVILLLLLGGNSSLLGGNNCCCC